jgi:hypothetical protein
LAILVEVICHNTQHRANAACGYIQLVRTAD